MWPRPPEVEVSDDPADPIRRRYRILRRLLAANSEMLELIAERESDLRHLDPSEPRLRQPILHLLESSLLLAENLNLLTDNRYLALYEAHAEIERAVRMALLSFPSPSNQPLLVRLEDASRATVREVGGKAGALGELRAVLPGSVPAGFVITTAAYRLFLRERNLGDAIRKLLRDLSLQTNREQLAERTAAIRTLLGVSDVPRAIVDAISAGVSEVPTAVGTRWAVRSSAVGEDGGRWSFAGQFDSVLDVSQEGLVDAYKAVVASRWADRAVMYRLLAGFAEVDTPMAVLFLPMVEARSAGVMYTKDPRDPQSDRMLVNSAFGLADSLVQGRAAADTFLLSRSRPVEILEQRAGRRGSLSLTHPELERLVETGLRIERHFGSPQDIEWVLASDGELKIVQSRPLRLEDAHAHGGQMLETRSPILSGGMTIFAGRAVGPAHVETRPGPVGPVPDGCVLVVTQASPELGPVLPVIGGVIAEQGNVAGHAATLIREFGIPALFGVQDAASRISTGRVVSLDATRRAVYEGALWPGVAQQVETRIQRWRSGKRRSPLGELIVALNLTDPLSLSFRASKCKSVHDIVRFAHEKAVSAMFELGDAAAQRRRRTWRLDSPIPLNLTLMDLGGAVPEVRADKRSVDPRDVRSIPFQALWRGMADPRVTWAGRSQLSVSGFASVMTASMVDARASIRSLGDSNYLIVAPEYMNLNARLAYHFAMVDALLTDVPENNYVSFRFRGGGAGADRRELRGRFLAEVLLRSGFRVDQRGDLVTAWLRRFPTKESEEALATLGRVMACARQLDMLMDDERSVGRFVERFFQGDFGAFT
ncbi:MAG: pyruvate, water dikinase [Deltaproteobacteria bacterium]|nr:pyruvate, water dikinase [Deltaproteobacteria bacterium]